MENSFNIAGMENLLEKISNISHKYEILKKENSFNIFGILRNYHEEKGLHSRFIYEMLNPRGSHGLGTRPLKLFVGTFKLEDFFTEEDIEKSEVYREYRNIDILVKTDSKALIIENKIHADDQPAQIRRYHDIVCSEGISEENIKIIYLALDGHEASEDSVAGLDKGKIETFSYETVIEWISKCAGISAKKPYLREALFQYIDVINILLGRTTTMKEFKEIFELFKKSEDILNAKKIVENWENISMEIELIFWNSIREKIKSENGYSIFYDGVGNSIENGEHGIVIDINTLLNNEYKIFLKVQAYRKREFQLYYGIHILESDRVSPRSEIKNTQLASITDEMNKSDVDDVTDWWWLGYKLAVNNKFDEDFLQIVENEKRKQYIDKFWTEITNFAKNKSNEIQEVYKSILLQK